MTRAEKTAAKAAGVIFDRAGWPWRVERRSRHTILIATPPNGRAVNIIITACSREGTGQFVAAAHAKRLLRQHGCL